jgi:putative SOS response-associated peptidase YedK
MPAVVASSAPPKQKASLKCRTDEQLLYLAGLWERWDSPSGDMIETCTIITKDAEEALSAIHNRVPVIVPKESCSVWLMLGDLKSLLASEQSVGLTATRVRPVVNNPKYDHEDCLAAA